ncbi:uncharacterized protein RAG0_13122 [Rhynchosporium agropyri]|uniref:Capsule polysaccharide synthase Cps1 n=1 Tax=Rhynchosporium agropyri TaxID=914238 RepID=A0A1E1LBN6_9HELO|nr:uncharacterized protein RAG0_13122 [Rhynchosporium agropyri]
MSRDMFSFIIHVLSTISLNSSRLAKSVVWDWLPFKFFIGLYLTFAFHAEIQEALELLYAQNSWLIAFEVLFLFKFVKVVVHTLSFLLYKPYPVPPIPTVTCRDVTVIIPTVGLIDEDEFRETLRTILANLPAEIIVCTVGKDKLGIAERVCAEELTEAELLRPTPTRIQAIAVNAPSKRKQIFEAFKHVRTSIVALADDHVFWGERYLVTALAPFEDPKIGGVGTNKRVRRQPFQFSFANFLNFTACNYLERHNFECTASVNIDQAVFVISGRTAFYRTAIFKHPRFEKEYCRETWFFGLVGKEGFDVDDDNLLTRFTIGVAKYKVWFQNSPDCTLETTLGDPGKFFKQMDRWIRTTWRSNSTSLFSDMTPWKTQPWSVYAVYFSSFVNFALLYDIALFTTLWYGSGNAPFPWLHSCLKWEDGDWSRQLSSSHCAPALWFSSLPNALHEIDRATFMWFLAIMLFLTKMIKPLPHFWRNPADTTYIPFYILFGYYHSLIKFKALLTVWAVSWGTRPGMK